MEAALHKQFDDLERLANEWELPQTGRKMLAKARKAVAQMAATLAFFWNMFNIKAAALQLSEELRASLAETLLAAAYLELASCRASKAEDRHRLRKLSLLLSRKARDGPLRQLSDERREEVESVFRDCAGIFQRSSSCVEGRNGRLALQHHGIHRLSGTKLAALTTLHNYFIKRADHTTAAERFFGTRPRELFPWLLERLPMPPRPRRHA